MTEDKKENELKDVTKELAKLIASIKFKELTVVEIFALVYNILDREYNVPRTHKESSKRDSLLILLLTKLLDTHYTDDMCLAIVAKLGENMMRKLPPEFLMNPTEEYTR